MEFVVPCLIDISGFILIGISFVSILMTSSKVIMRVKGHQVQFQNYFLSFITNLCLLFLSYDLKPTWASKQQPVLK